MHPITLYHTEWGPECALVRRRPDELEIAYKRVIVLSTRPFRTRVFKVSGQYDVPVLVDGDTVLTETQDILRHLDAVASTPKGPASKGREPVESLIGSAPAPFGPMTDAEAAVRAEVESHPPPLLTRQTDG